MIATAILNIPILFNLGWRNGRKLANRKRWPAS